jgi:uncharacterized protein DUF898
MDTVSHIGRLHLHQDAMEPGADAAGDALLSQEKTPAATPFQFTGRAGEFFKIWIVNVLLTIVTRGGHAILHKLSKNGNCQALE